MQGRFLMLHEGYFFFYMNEFFFLYFIFLSHHTLSLKRRIYNKMSHERLYYLHTKAYLSWVPIMFEKRLTNLRHRKKSGRTVF